MACSEDALPPVDRGQREVKRMRLTYGIDLPCAVKQAVGGEAGLLAQLRLREAVLAADAAGVAEHAPLVIERPPPAPKATEEAPTAAAVSTGEDFLATQTLALSDARALLANLAALAKKACVGCPANRFAHQLRARNAHDTPAAHTIRVRRLDNNGDLAGTLGCLGVLPLPITRQAEEWTGALLRVGLDKARARQPDLRTLLVDLLRGSERDGAEAARLRSVDSWFARPRGIEFRRGILFRKLLASTDRLFAYALLVPSLSAGSCLFLAAFAGGIEVAERERVGAGGVGQRAPRESDVPAWQASTMHRPDDAERGPVQWRYALDPARDLRLAGMSERDGGGERDLPLDAGVHALGRFFLAAFHAYSLGRGLRLEVEAMGVAEPAN